MFDAVESAANAAVAVAIAVAAARLFRHSAGSKLLIWLSRYFLLRSFLLAVIGTSGTEANILVLAEVLVACAAAATADAFSGKVVVAIAAMAGVFPRPFFSPPATSFNVDVGNVTLDKISTAADTAAVDVMFVRGLKTTLLLSSSSSDAATGLSVELSP